MTKKKKDMLFVPFDQDDFLPGHHGTEYLNEIIWTLIENVNELRKKPMLTHSVMSSRGGKNRWKGKTKAEKTEHSLLMLKKRWEGKKELSTEDPK